MRKVGLFLAAAAIVAALYAPSVSAQTPTCGTVIDTPDTVVVFDSDMACPAGFTGTALTILADDVTVDGAGFSILAPEASYMISASGVSNLIVQDLNASGNTGTGLYFGYITTARVSGVTASGTDGSGMYLRHTSGMEIEGNTVTGRRYGLYFIYDHTGNVVNANTLTDNTYGIYDLACCARSNNTFTNNDVSRSSDYGIWLHAEDNVTIGGNDFTDCANGMRFGGVSGVALSGWDFSSFNIPGVALWIHGVNDSLISNINASGTGHTGSGIAFYADGTTLSNCTVHGRYNGILMGDGAEDNIVTANNLSDNVTGISVGGGPHGGNSYTDNDVSDCSTGIIVSLDPGFTLSGNDYTNCTRALELWGMDGLEFTEPRDFSAFNISGLVLYLRNITNSVISNINASGSGYVGGGISVWGDGNVVSGCTVHGRNAGIVMGDNSEYNVIRDNNLSGNNYAVVSGGGPRLGNSYIDNDCSGSIMTGLDIREDDGLVRGNHCRGSGTGIYLLQSHHGTTVSGNDVSGCVNTGLYLRDQTGVTVEENLIANSGNDGLILVNSPTTTVYHNNIYGNADDQVYSSDPIELSYGNEGNYWGRQCTDGPETELFVAGEDSNAIDVMDSFAYGTENAWDQEIDPGCGPPPPGWISGEVWDDVAPVDGVTMTLEDSGQEPLTETVTDGYGDYGFDDLGPGIYYVSMIVPIGFAGAPGEQTRKEAIVNSGAETRVDFILERLVVEVDTRGMGFWKHQAKVHVKGKGNAHETEQTLLDYLADVQDQYDVFDHVVGVEGLLSVLEPPKPPTMRERTEQHLMALVLNLASLRIATYTEVSADDTCGEAIDLIIEVLDAAGSANDELEAAKDLAEDINEGRLPLDPERIPEPAPEGGE